MFRQSIMRQKLSLKILLSSLCWPSIYFWAWGLPSSVVCISSVSTLSSRTPSSLDTCRSSECCPSLCEFTAMSVILYLVGLVSLMSSIQLKNIKFVWVCKSQKNIKRWNSSSGIRIADTLICQVNSVWKLSQYFSSWAIEPPWPLSQDGQEEAGGLIWLPIWRFGDLCSCFVHARIWRIKGILLVL